mmetsp:Transcript_95602/g.219011  ORF Transcript_95602/g.219011 Transcript_95602/m.219011 type:complete len:146 (+) Transcript_95602:2590-3027(+)
MSGTLVGAPVGHSFIEPGLFPVDPRLHVGVNCASRSCPDLHTEAFTGDRVDEQLDALMRAFLADETKGLACAGSSEMKVSKLAEHSGHLRWQRVFSSGLLQSGMRMIFRANFVTCRAFCESTDPRTSGVYLIPTSESPLLPTIGL